MIDVEDFVPNRITQLRLAKGVSARDMSLSIGQSSGYVNNIENRVALPSMRGFSYICEYFGITHAEFFDEENHYPAHISAVVEELRTLDAQQLEALQAVIRGFQK